MQTLRETPDKELKLNIIHLEDLKKHQEKFRSVFNSRVRERFKKFFESNFDARCAPALFQHSTVADFAGALLRREGSRYFPTETALHAGLFVLDFVVPESAGAKAREIDGISIHDELAQSDVDFLTWLRHYFPSVPVVFLTSGKGLDVPQPWTYIPKDLLDNRDGFTTLLSQHAERWWRPSFSNELERYADETADSSWHTPGHNAGNAFLQSVIQRGFYKSYGPMIFRTDLSVSVKQLGDLSEPEPEQDSPLEESRRRSAEIFGSRDTFYVTNGTSTSNKAILQTLLRAGDVALVDRNCHKSVHQAVVMSGVLPLYLPAAFNLKLGVWSPLSLDLLSSFLKAKRPEPLRPRLMVITSCTYEGVLYPVGRLARECEQNEVLFMADEAWAPHLRFHSFYANESGTFDRYNATDAGAHVSVQSTHKCLAAFSQASMIHISDQLRYLLEEATDWEWLKERFRFGESGSYLRFKHQLFEVLRYWNSTSPHYPMLATLDRAGIQMRLEGMHLIDERLRWALDFERSVPSTVRLEHVVGADRLGRYVGFRKDPLKLVIAGAEPDSVRAMTKSLNRHHIMWEKSTSGCIEFLITIGTLQGNLESLRRFLDEPEIRPLHQRPLIDSSAFDFDSTVDQVDVLPRVAVSGDGELRSLEELMQIAKSGGTLPVCAQMVTPYPPGIPIMLPGLRLTEPMINNVLHAIANGEVHGIHSRNNKHYLEVMTKRDEEAAMADPLLVQFLEWRRTQEMASLLSKGDR